MPFFTVVIALYNKENFVAETVKSVLSQTFSDFEVIAVNDASSDNTVSIVQSFNDARIRIVHHEKNQGLSAARNTGIRNANADFIAFIDADDFWRPDFLKTISDLISTFPTAGIFATNYLEAFPGGKLIEPKQHLAIEKGQSGIVADYFTSALAQPILWYGSVAVRKTTFEKAGYFDESVTLSEDIDFNIRAAMVTDIAFSNTFHAIYNVYTENQIMNSPLSGKRFPDFGKYEVFAKERPSVKAYLDINRQILAVKAKASGDVETFGKLVREIEFDNLTLRQRLLLKLPAFAIRLLKNIKVWSLGKGVRLTTFKH